MSAAHDPAQDAFGAGGANVISLRVLTAGSLVLTLACGGSEGPAPAAPPRQAAPAAAPATAPAEPQELLMRGIVRLDPEPTFQSCDDPVRLPLLDSTGNRLNPPYRLMRPTEQDGMYVLARGVVSPSGERILRHIELASRPAPGEGCDQAAPEYLVRVQGVDTAWTVTLGEQGVELTQPTEPLSIGFEAPTVDESRGGTLYRAATSGGEHTLEVLLEATRCSHGNSGTVTSMKATVTLDGTPRSGCAWRGKLP